MHYPNKMKDDLNYFTDNSCTNIDDYLNKPILKHYDNKDDEYKDDNSQALKTDKIVIKN